MDDTELLRLYAESRSEKAFATLVQRHLDRVYAVALRQVGGDVHLAEDIVQSVFSTLARKAPSLTSHPVLGGWLFQTTRYAAIDCVRRERRRREREKEANLMQEFSSETSNATDWDRFRPLLDQTMAELPDRDRDAVWLRFFDGRSFADIGHRFGLTENAARMRVDRALEKLHAALGRHGVTSTGAAAIAAALAAQGSLAAPAGMAASVTGTALAAAAAGGGAAGLLTFIAMNKIPLTITSALAVAGATGAFVQHDANTQLRRELAALHADAPSLAALQADNLRLANAAAEAADLQRDDAESRRLREEAAALRAQLEQLERAAADAAAARPAAPDSSQLAALDRVPAVSAQPMPRYPQELQAAGIGGQVVVGFIVDSNGAVRDAYVTQSTQSEFEAAALEAVKQWEFTAGLKGGRLVNTRMQVPIVFGAGAGDGDPLPSDANQPEWVQLSPIHVSATDSENAAKPTAPDGQRWF